MRSSECPLLQILQSRKMGSGVSRRRFVACRDGQPNPTGEQTCFCRQPLVLQLGVELLPCFVDTRTIAAHTSPPSDRTHSIVGPKILLSPPTAIGSSSALTGGSSISLLPPLLPKTVNALPST